MDKQKNTENNKLTVNPEFIIEVQGQSFVKYEGLLDVAHQIGLVELSVDLIQIPTQDNNWTAICHATGITDNGAVFADYGDASVNSVSRNLTPHIIRMASTRAKARVLRDMTNIGITALEEVDMEVVAGKKDVIAKPNSLKSEALKLQGDLVAQGRVLDLGKITGGRRVEAISENELPKIVKELKKIIK